MVLRVNDDVVDYGYKQHYRVNHSANEFSKSGNHINGIENFRGLCKVRLAKVTLFICFKIDKKK